MQHIINNSTFILVENQDMPIASKISEIQNKEKMVNSRYW